MVWLVEVDGMEVLVVWVRKYCKIRELSLLQYRQLTKHYYSVRFCPYGWLHWAIQLARNSTLIRLTLKRLSKGSQKAPRTSTSRWRSRIWSIRRWKFEATSTSGFLSAVSEVAEFECSRESWRWDGWANNANNNLQYSGEGSSNLVNWMTECQRPTLCK